MFCNANTNSGRCLLFYSGLTVFCIAQFCAVIWPRSYSLKHILVFCGLINRAGDFAGLCEVNPHVFIRHPISGSELSLTPSPTGGGGLWLSGPVFTSYQIFGDKPGGVSRLQPSAPMSCPILPVISAIA